METIKRSHRLVRNQASTDYGLADIDLPFLIANMKRSDAWANGELHSLILLKNPVEQIVLTAMHEGTEIESFQSNDSVTFHIIQGNLNFHILKNSVTIKKDQFMILKEHIKYRLTTQEETIFLLTISNDITSGANN